MAYIKLHTEFTPEVKEKIVFKVINRNRNEQLLKNIPHIDYLDLAIVFYLADGDNEFIRLSNELMDMWKVDVNALMDAAIDNTPRILGLKIRGILSTLASYLTDEEFEKFIENQENLGAYPPIYVATNNRAYNGAGVLIYKDALRAMSAKLKSNLFIIPCSIHEIIILKAMEDCDYSTEYLKDMISQVNSTELSPDDILSDNLYFYNRHTGELGIA